MQFDRLVNTFSSSVSKFQDIQQVCMYVCMYVCVYVCTLVATTCFISHSQQMTSNLEKELITKARSSSVNRSVSVGMQDCLD